VRALELTKQIHARFERQCRFAIIYISEAHAKDDWKLPPMIAKEIGEGAAISLAQTLDDRIAAATRFRSKYHLQAFDVFCDSLSDEVMDVFEAWPERAYVIDEGNVVFKGGRGPFDFDMNKVQDFLQAYLATRSGK